MNGDALFFDPRRHYEALALLASEQLERGEFRAAFRYADRRCRLAKNAHDFLLRAEASRRAGETRFAAKDLARAIEIDPTDPLVNRMVLRQGSPEQKRSAARATIAAPATDRDALRPAVAFLFDDGARMLFRLGRDGLFFRGWLAWAGKGPLRMILQAEEALEFEVPADPDHWLAGASWSCAEIETPDESGGLRRLDFFLDGAEVGSFSPPPAPWRRERKSQCAASPAPNENSGVLNVIVPVYEDFDATRACLEALLREKSRIARRLMVVDDASPDARLRAWLDQRAAMGLFELIRTERNLGFAASVNRALAFCPQGDVLLVNADVSPPPAFLDRLAEIARSAPDIGTVTPLSNNGEFTSFPERFVVNPLPEPEEIARLDNLAQRANGALTIDMPNGIGFCLYITRACLDAVGPLPEIYDRGYYEDVEFCLRAREKGFRNVCAAGVYVGHAGARSFGADKRRLVMRNLAALERRFPAHTLECASFLEADPLKKSCGAVEALAPMDGDVVLLVCGEGASDLLAREEARRIADAEDEPAPLVCACAADGASVAFRAAGAGAPQSLQLSLRSGQGLRTLESYLRATNLRRIEIFDPSAPPDALLALLLELDLPISLVCADLDWVFPLRLPPQSPCRAPDSAEPCPSCAADVFALAEEDAPAPRLERWRGLLARDAAIKPLDPMGEIFVAQVFAGAQVAETPAPAPAAPVARVSASGGVLAVVTPQPSALSDRLIVALGHALLRGAASNRIVVLGRCADDLAVMSLANVFVAGKVETDEYERLLRQYEVSALMSPYRTRFFGRLDRLSRIYGLPKAFFDWTFGKTPAGAGDLSLDPRLCDAKAAARIAGWLVPDAGGLFDK